MLSRIVCLIFAGFFKTRNIPLPAAILGECSYFLTTAGKSEKEPNMYPFGTSYDEIYEDLKTKERF